jgi:hypothetical protein
MARHEKRPLLSGPAPLHYVEQHIFGQLEKPRGSLNARHVFVTGKRIFNSHAWTLVTFHSIQLACSAATSSRQFGVLSQTLGHQVIDLKQPAAGRHATVLQQACTKPRFQFNSNHHSSLVNRSGCSTCSTCSPQRKHETDQVGSQEHSNQQAHLKACENKVEHGDSE